ncbi:hypothetical protein [Leucobacter ruminantium]|uniref:Uncharacterized protein n=1 Tax=Leucobacter ruminantium TaxID=1289170 RepID=A0A939LWK5_9MICO|nr:hypothetical protein [Leucobacter ruminantium]MBO1804268.1 hypothetical protein [Leucobacter ruminantium]
MRHAAEYPAFEKHAAAPSPHWDRPHDGNRTEAPNGHGTVRRWPPGKTLDRPVLDGATQPAESEHDVDNPWRGLADPGLVNHPGGKPSFW